MLVMADELRSVEMAERRPWPVSSRRRHSALVSSLTDRAPHIWHWAITRAVRASLPASVTPASIMATVSFRMA